MSLVEIILNSCGEVEKVKKIQGSLEACPDEDKLKLLTEKDISGRTPLHRAAERGHTEVVKALLEACPAENKFALLTEKDRSGSTPLCMAVIHGHEVGNAHLTVSNIKKY